MMLIAILLILGVSLSAFFSGSETGFYRVTRVRLVMDAKSGNWISRTLLWLVNHSSVVVATVLIGNNIANYLVSFGLILASQYLFADRTEMQSLLPILMAPLLFVYGELLPKFLYYQVPYKLLNRGAPFMVLCSLLFSPVALFVIALERIWQRLLGTNSIKAGSTLERQELQRVLVEGQEAGVLLPVQREIAQNIFTYGVRPVRQFAVPLRAIPLVTSTDDRDEILKQAARRGLPIVGVMDDSGGRLIGCYLVADILIHTGPELPLLPVCSAAASESHIQVLTRMQQMQSPMAAIADAAGKTIAIVEKERLTTLLLSPV
jgi:putative hemolysin